MHTQGSTRATVQRVLPNEMFLVQTEHGEVLRVHVSGKLRNGFIRLLPGDLVYVDASPFDASKGRIVLPTRDGVMSSESE